MTRLQVIQFAVPLILIVWLVWVPARSDLGFAVQVFSSSAAMAVMALQGIWLLPPWWAPFVFAVGLGVAAWLGRRRIRPFSSAVPRTWGRVARDGSLRRAGHHIDLRYGHRMAQPHHPCSGSRESGLSARAGSLTRRQWRQQKQHQRAPRNARRWRSSLPRVAWAILWCRFRGAGRVRAACPWCPACRPARLCHPWRACAGAPRAGPEPDRSAAGWRPTARQVQRPLSGARRPHRGAMSPKGSQ